MAALPKEGRPIEVNSELIPDETDEYDSVFEAKLAIADRVGMNLGDLPDWIVEEIEGALAESLERAYVRNLAAYVGDFVRSNAAM